MAGVSGTGSGRRHGDGGTLRGRVVAILALLVIGNLTAWGWAFVAFRSYPVLLGTATLAYSFGLRHAFDADHIAAIDNVTRRLMADGRRPVAVGLFFSLGHSTVVAGLSLAIALAAGAVEARFTALRTIGASVGTLVSAGFLVAIAVANVVVLASVLRTARALRRGTAAEAALDTLPVSRGPLGLLLGRVVRGIGRSWQMYPLGILFGLGFDTATEIGLLGISATQASHGLPIWSILVFPALFTAGMTLLDTADSLLMLGAYGWALERPLRRVYYNLAVTAASVLVAVGAAGLEVLGQFGDALGRKGGGAVWAALDAVDDNVGLVGAGIVGLFAAAWAISAAIAQGEAVEAGSGPR